MGINRIPVTEMQARLAALLIGTPGIGLAEALRQTGYAETTAQKWATATVRSPGVQQALAVQMQEQGITDEVVLDRLSEALVYQKTTRIKTGSTKDGTERVSEFVDVDNSGRLAAVELAAKLKGWIRPEDREKVLVIVQEAVMDALAPIIARHILPEARGAFARDLAALREPGAIDLEPARVKLEPRPPAPPAGSGKPPGHGIDR